MIKNKIHLSEGFSLPLDVVGEAIGILATRGAGKSHTAAVMVEEMFASNIQVVILDPTGVFWGLRGSGEKDGLPIYVFGGQHGDLPLEPGAGEMLADLAVDDGHSFVLDLSGFDTKGEQTRFVRTFAERLYRRKAHFRSTLHLIVDEADEFAPQKPLGRDEPFMLGAMETLVRRGRSRGLGVTMISQRSAALNKNVLALSETLIVMRTPSPQDRKAIEGWVSHHHLADELGVLDSLPGLRTGTAWVWSPVRDVLKQVDIRRIRTFDSYRSPKAGEIPAQPRKMAEIDLKELGKRMSATVERAQASDPRVLRRKIEELSLELRKRPETETTIVKEVPVEVPVLSDSVIAELETIVQQLRDTSTQMIEPIIIKIDEIMLALTERKRVDSRTLRVVGSSPPVAQSTRKEEGPANNNGFVPSASQQKVLDAIAWLESTGLDAPRLRVGFLSGYRQTGHFNNLISSLSAEEAIDYPIPGIVALTEKGKQLARYPVEALTTAEVHERVLSQLKPVQQRVLQIVLSKHPEDISRDDLAAEAGYTVNGHFNNLVSGLSSLSVIERSRAAHVRAADLMFV